MSPVTKPSPRIVVFGATGYTGELAARALVRRGARPVLAGRHHQRLARLAAELGGLETAVADAGRPATLRALVDAGDVLVTTVGPFARLGTAAVEAAIAARATYVDSNAEPTFLRQVFERYGLPAEAAGVALLPAIGYESVPGNLAAALALTEAGEPAASVEVAYFTTGDFRASGGTRASFALAALAPGFAFRGGRVVRERQARRVRTFEVGDGRRQAVSASMAEHFTLPRAFARLREVDVYLGWTGRASHPLQVASLAGTAITRIPGVRAGVAGLTARAVRGSTGGPSKEERGRSRSHVLARARDDAGRALAEVRLEGIDGYELTGNLLAWAASRAAEGRVRGVGALGPVEGFGLAEVEAGCAEAGMSAGTSRRPRASSGKVRS